MRALDAIAHRYGQRPSAILGITDGWAAYQFDLAVISTGGKDEGKPESFARKPEAPFSAFGGKARVMKVPESGVW